METTEVYFSQERADKGTILSRSFASRTDEETHELYDMIKDAVLCAQNPQNEDSEKALAFVVYVFDPKIREVASKIYPFVKDFEEYDDTLQETYATFINLVYGYNPAISAFPYYIKNMLPRQVRAWSHKTRKKASCAVDMIIVDNTLVDPSLDSKDGVYDRYNSYVFQREYEDFITQRAEKKAKSNTVKEVCYNYFLGHKTCSQISKELGISYHASYEVINRIKAELKVFLKENCFSDYRFED